ncbi:MAG: VOC family protein [Gemmatimonadota bacterium]
MLSRKDAIATVAVKDMRAAQAFYEGTLGLKLVHTEGNDAREYQSGNSKILVYVSRYAGTNQATAVTWELGGDVEKIVRDLKSKGVSFEHYDLPDTRRDGDLHIAGKEKVAWFKDPDGNIHALIGQ